MTDALSITLRSAREHLERGRYEEAIAAYDAALAAWPESVEALHGRALAQERQGALDEALASCARALAIAADHVPALLTKGSIHARRDERMTAMDCFRRVTRLAPDLTTAHHLLASVGGKGVAAPLRGEVVGLFDGCAERFDRHLVEDLGYRGHRVLSTAVVESSGTRRASWTVFDLGCGTGLCGPALRPLAGSLVGVDVSPRVLDRARERGVYDVLYVADLVYALAMTDAGRIDLVVSADVFGYVGELTPVFVESARALAMGGRLAFTVEAGTGDPDFALGPSRRFAYSQTYLRRLASTHGFTVDVLRTVPLRREQGRDVLGHVAVLRKPC